MHKQIIRRNEQPIASLDELLLSVYRSRGCEGGLPSDYSLTHLLRPTAMLGMAEALDLLEAAARQQQRILIIGDFDADGATSTALAVRCLRALGFLQVDYLVPNRFEFGYGLTPEIVAVAAQLEPDLIITVDNGISSIEGVAAAQALGIRVLVTDHHLPGAQTPKADAIVNPNQHGCTFASKHLAGVGVIFYVLSALRGRLRERGWFDQQGIALPNMADYLDLVALGTVADVVPLDYNNRILVANGLARMRAGRAVPGINALLQVAGRPPHNLVASDLGFAIAPRLNAAGRLDDMSLGIRCLLSDAHGEALQLAQDLDDLNRDRRVIEAAMKDEALKIIDRFSAAELAEVSHGVCLFKPDWHQGVIGILASRIKDKLHRPTIVFAQCDNGELKGSGRSIPGLHLRDALDQIATRNPGLLQKFGGHAMAAGLSIKAEQLDTFAAAFNACVKQQLDDEQLRARIYSDGALHESLFHLETAQALRDAGPWGQNFPEPLFDGEFDIVQQRAVGEKHLKLTLAPARYSNTVVDAIAFNIDRSVWPNDRCQRVKLAYRLDVNEFRGERNLQLMVDYLEPLFAEA